MPTQILGAHGAAEGQRVIQIVADHCRGTQHLSGEYSAIFHTESRAETLMILLIIQIELPMTFARYRHSPDELKWFYRSPGNREQREELARRYLNVAETPPDNQRPLGNCPICLLDMAAADRPKLVKWCKSCGNGMMGPCYFLYKSRTLADTTGDVLCLFCRAAL